MVNVNAAKVVAQIAILGSQILVKAFAEAYRQAAQNAAKQAATSGSRMAAGVAGETAGSGSVALTRKLNLTLEEASKILNVEKDASLDKIKQRYELLFNTNDPAKGGTLYLRSKIYRAKERIELEFEDALKKQ